MTYLKIDKTNLVNLEYSLRREIIRTNRSGAYSCSTIIDCNTRKYHGLLICPLQNHGGQRHVLLSCLHESIIQHDKEFNLGMHKYAGDHYEPKGHKYINDFISSPIPTLEYHVGGVKLTKEKVLVENENQLLIRYTLIEASSPVKLRLKPFLAYRNIHSLSKSNLNIETHCSFIDNGVQLVPYETMPELNIQLSKKNEYVTAPDWYYNVEYNQDQERGYDYKEDLYTPGFFEIDLKTGESIVFSASLTKNSSRNLKTKFNNEVKKRIPRDNFNTCLANTVQQFFIHNDKSIEIIAGFPWHEVRTRDALIAIPGLSLPFYDDKSYLKVLKTIAAKFNNHLLPDEADSNNRNYPADIPLWFIWSVQQFGILYNKKKAWSQFGSIIETILEGYFSEKQHFEILNNGLLCCKQNNYPNSWMNSLANETATATRTGCLIDVNALWYNALCFAGEYKNKLNENLFQKIKDATSRLQESILSSFWDGEQKYLYDFIDSEPNLQMRPNQILAASMPYSVLSKSQIKNILDKIETELLTPYGLRTLSPNDKKYVPIYEGNHEKREYAAFNGSVWPWLLAPLFEAWLKIDPKAAIRKGEKLLSNFESELQTDGICSISELYHGNPPHQAKGAISFAVNTAELIRLKNLVDNAYKIY